MKKINLIIIAVLCFILTALSSMPAQAKDYSFPSVNFMVKIKDNGVVHLEEKRTYDFDGSFTYAYENIGQVVKKYKQTVKLDNFKVYDGEKLLFPKTSPELDPNTYLKEYPDPDPDPDHYRLGWSFQAENQSKTFTISYDITGAVFIHPDATEFYWQLIGDQWDKGISAVKADVFLPENHDYQLIKAFGHGPLNGIVSIPENGHLVFTADSLPANKFFEVRALFDPAVIKSGGIEEKTNLASIQSEEDSFARQAEEQKNLFRYLVLAAMAVFFILTVLALITMSRVSRKVKKIKNQLITEGGLLSGKLHGPPSDLPPAEVESLLRKGSVSPNSFLATILDLVRRRIFKIRRSDKKAGFINKDYQYWLDPSDGKYHLGGGVAPAAHLRGENYEGQVGSPGVNADSLNPYEQQLFSYLTASVNTNRDEKIEFQEIKNYGKSRPYSAQTFFKKFEKEVKEALKDKNLLDSQNRDWQSIPYRGRALLFLVLAFLFLGSIFFILPFYAIALFALSSSILKTLFFAGIPLLYLCQILVIISYFKNLDLLGYSKRGYLAKMQWLAFKKYLKEYSVTDDDPVDSIIIWEKILCYGVTLGISIKALASLPINFSAQDKELFSTYYAGMSAASFGSADFTNSFSSLASTLQSLSTSSYGASGIGSSGGFSGGGGGGGGSGGGGGAG